jgi:L-lactate utilization protein LutC
MATVNEKQPSEKANTKGGISEFVRTHKMITFLLAALVILALWAFIKISLMENKFKKDTLKLKSAYENKIDSLTTRQLTLSSKVFSWAIRSELTRENKEQVNQFFMNFIKEPGVSKVEFVSALDGKVTLSTNKKDEGSVFPNQVAVMTTETINYRNDSVLSIVSPVMGLNNKLGVLVIEYNLNKNH